MSANDNIRAGVEDLQAKAKKVEVTVESLAAELEEARALAIGEKQTSAAVSATMGKAKLFGLGVENRRMSGSLQIVTLTAKDLDGLTPDELASLEQAYQFSKSSGLLEAIQGQRRKREVETSRGGWDAAFVPNAETVEKALSGNTDCVIWVFLGQRHGQPIRPQAGLSAEAASDPAPALAR